MDATSCVDGEAGELRGWSSRPLLLRICLRCTRGDLAEAEDLLGDACLRVMEAQHRGEPEPTRPISFWATVINNLDRDRLRRTRRWRFEANAGGVDPLGTLPALTINAERQVLLRECLEQTVRQLGLLNGKQRTAVLLRSRGSGYSSIAKALGTSQANARKLVETGRKALVSTEHEPRQKSRTTGPAPKRRCLVAEL